MQGVLGAFREIDSAVEAIEDLKKERFGDITVYTPTPRHEFDHALKHGPSKVRIFTLIFGLAGVTFGYWIPVWISDYWPLIVGGKQLPGLCLASISLIITEKVPLANGVAITYCFPCSLVFIYKMRCTTLAEELTCKFDAVLQEQFRM